MRSGAPARRIGPAGVSRDTIYADLTRQGIDYRDRSRPEPSTAPTVTAAVPWGTVTDEQGRRAPKTIRRVLDAAGARDLPGPLDMPPVRPGELDEALAPQDVVLDVPGRLADLLRITGDEVVRLALVSGRIIRRGPGYSVHLVAPLALHRAVLEQSAAAADSASPAERKAHRVYAARVAAVEATRLHGL